MKQKITKGTKEEIGEMELRFQKQLSESFTELGDLWQNMSVSIAANTSKLQTR